MLVSVTAKVRECLIVAAALVLIACGGGGGGGNVPGAADTESPPDPTSLTNTEAARFLSQATFGPNAESIAAVVDLGMEGWLLDQFSKPTSSHLDTVLAAFPENGVFLGPDLQPPPELRYRDADSFWERAIKGEDQLRQRMAYALSQIIVISSLNDSGRFPHTMAHGMDILTEGAFGNYRDLLEAVTYSPVMAKYLSYLYNRKADPETGRVPDENFAREILQLFSIGLVELNPDGTPVIDAEGNQVELFDNSDITGLAKVFTGLSFVGTGFGWIYMFPEGHYSPIAMYDSFHSHEPKTFLDVTIPANTGGEESIERALDAIFSHPNVGPFLSRQLIQRFVTSAPTPAYVERVARSFDAGSFTLPTGGVVGSGVRGDLKAVIAAILFDPRARDSAARNDPHFGKLREPVLRFTHWARAFNVNSADASNEPAIHGALDPNLLGQHPYRSPSVFNFYRPGYVPPGTEAGAAGLTVPEFQITTNTTIVGYQNFMALYAFGLSPQYDPQRPRAFVGDYSPQVALANDARALMDNLDELLTHGTLHDETRDRIEQVLDAMPGDSDDARLRKARVAGVMVMTSPEYLVLR